MGVGCITPPYPHFKRLEKEMSNGGGNLQRFVTRLKSDRQVCAPSDSFFPGSACIQGVVSWARLYPSPKSLNNSPGRKIPQEKVEN